MALKEFEVHHYTNVLKTDRYKVTARSKIEAEEYLKEYIAEAGKYAQPKDTTYEPLPGRDCTYEVYNVGGLKYV